ncbi:MAG: fasciclin domain-containing protein [Cytophagales bacterium]|nr:fasciclin domain-containing protein [Cytophagales bacterium]
MKKYLKQLQATGLFALMVPALLLTGCNDDDNNTQPQQSIAQVVNTNSDFSLLRAAVTKAGLADALNTGTLTVFAPNNAAFQASGLNEAALNMLTQAQARAVLEYHVVNSRQTAASLPSGDNSAVTALSGGTLYVTKNGNNVSVNGAQVIQADVEASNGVIHVVDRVLLPPVGNIVETAVALGENFTYLVAAVQRANVAGVLSGAGPLTVFAPVNQAFIAAGFPTIASIQAADPAALTTILTYHVVPGRVFSTNLTTSNVATAQGGNVSVNVGTGVQVTGLGNGGNAANVVRPNVVATNGVIHAIDRVLLPAN